jgi:hypothetical protein
LLKAACGATAGENSSIGFGGSATAFPNFKVSVKNGLFLWKMTADTA